MVTRKWSVVAIVVLLLLPVIAQAQESQAGRLSGVVKDAQGAVIPGAGVVAVNQETKSEFRARTDGIGAWTMDRVPAGTYTVTVTAPATVPGVFKDIKVGAGSPATVDATLQVGISETVEVTASRTQEQLVNAPAAVSIVSQRTIQDLPTQDFADLMRTIPGVNVAQVSARDFNVTPRAATNIVAQNQLVMVDDRTILQDYFGYVAWDFMPNSLDDVKQIEVLRGAASVMWGASAMNGVVNIITKSPREVGTYFTLGGGTFDRKGGVADSNSGSLFYFDAAHGQALNDRWAMKASVGYFTTDPLARPAGTIPNQYQTPYPPFKNYGTSHPKADLRVDYDAPDGQQHVSFSGGWGATGGTFHTGLGPFHLNQGANGAYVKGDYRYGTFALKSFVNLWKGTAASLLAVGPFGNPLILLFRDNTWDISAEKTLVAGTRNLFTFGGSFRHNWCEITMAPGADTRDLGGAFVQDEIQLSDHVRWNIGGRVDKFDSLDHVVASPRTALMISPMEGSTFRVSYSRAYRAPSMFQNYLSTVVVNRMNLGLLNPLLAGQFYYFPVTGSGSLSLKEQTLDSYEVGWQGVLAQGRAHAGATFYLNDSRNDMILSQSNSYTSQNPPPNWPLPPFILDALVAGNAFGPGLGLPSVIMFQNLGEFRNKGVEISFDARPHRYVSLFANYSWQARPCQPGDGGCAEVNAPPPSSIATPKINLPPKNRFNAGFTFDYGRVLTDLSVQYTSPAYFRDVLDATYAAWTEAFTVVNAGVSVRLYRNNAVIGVKIRNLGNKPVQNHIFGDLLKRQVLFELKLRG